MRVGARAPPEGDARAAGGARRSTRRLQVGPRPAPGAARRCSSVPVLARAGAGPLGRASAGSSRCSSAPSRSGATAARSRSTGWSGSGSGWCCAMVVSLCVGAARRRSAVALVGDAVLSLIFSTVRCYASLWFTFADCFDARPTTGAPPPDARRIDRPPRPGDAVMNKVAIVTGAGSGIGRASALALLKAGWQRRARRPPRRRARGDPQGAAGDARRPRPARCRPT